MANALTILTALMYKTAYYAWLGNKFSYKNDLLMDLINVFSLLIVVIYMLILFERNKIVYYYLSFVGIGLTLISHEAVGIIIMK